MTTRWARFARGWIAAVVSVFVALFSHMLAGGQPPSPVGLMLCLAFAGMTCIALTGRSLSLPRLSIAVVASQLMFHGAFSLLGGPAAPMSVGSSSAATRAMTMTMPGSMSGSMTMPVPMSMDGHPAAFSSMSGGMAMPSWMWVAHVIAAVLTIAVLRFGESAFWQCLALARPFVRRLLLGSASIVEPLHPRVSATAIEQLPKRLDAMLDIIRHRGPPAIAALY